MRLRMGKSSQRKKRLTIPLISRIFSVRPDAIGKLRLFQTQSASMYLRKLPKIFAGRDTISLSSPLTLQGFSIAKVDILERSLLYDTQ